MAKTTKKDGKSTNIRVPRIRKTGDLDDLRRYTWQVLHMCYTVLRSDEASLEDKRQFGHLLSQTAGQYGKLLEATDLYEQLESIKVELAELRNSEGLRKVV